MTNLEIFLSICNLFLIWSVGFLHKEVKGIYKILDKQYELTTRVVRVTNLHRSRLDALSKPENWPR